MASLTDAQKQRAIELRKKGWTNTDIGREFGVSETTVRRFLVNEVGMDRQTPHSRHRMGAKIGGDPKDRTIQGLKDEVSRLQTELTNSHRQVLLETEIRKILRVAADKPANPPNWVDPTAPVKKDEEVPVAIWSDWHGGEYVSKDEVNGVNEFNVNILRARVRKLIERTIHLTEHHHAQYPGIIINLLGDFISGGLHPEHQKHDELGVLASSLEIRDILIWAIKTIADKFGRVYLPCTAGNHGRNTPRPEFKKYVYKNYDWLIYKLLEKYFADDNRIQFDIPPANEVLYKVYSKRFLAMHGDMLGVKGGDGIIGAIGPIMRGEIKVRGSSVNLLSDYDMLLMGHWHQPLWLPRVIVANSLKGYDEYAKNALRAPFSPPSQPLFFVHPRYGITSRWEIYLESAPAERKENWVSVLQAA